MISSLLGIFVSLSTFLVINATSPLTYNVVGHVKTALILCGGYLLFGDEMTVKKVFGIMVAFGGIIIYSDTKLKQNKREMKKITSQGKLDYSKDLSKLVRGF